jgi:acetyl esterase/lipase
VRHGRTHHREARQRSPDAGDTRRAFPLTFTAADGVEVAAKLPPTPAPAFIGTAEYDPLRDDGARYAELLTAAGVPVQMHNAPTLVHGYVSYALAVPAAAEATNLGLAALKAALH